MLRHSPTTRPALRTRSFYLTALLLCLCLFFLLLPNGVFTQSSETCVQPPAGIIAWWPLDETSGATAADIVGNNTGAYANGPVPAAGNVAGAISFDGVDDFVLVPHSAALDFAPGSSMTIEAWAFRTSSAPVMHLVGKRQGCGGDFDFYQLAIGPNAVPSDAVPLNTWTHLAVTYDGETSTQRQYVNGSLVLTTGQTVGSNMAPLKIGNSGTCTPFGGLIDEVTIYNRTLSASEIQGIYDAGSAGKCKSGVQNGPVTSNVVANPNRVDPSVPVVLSATVSDAATGGSNVAAAEYNVNGGGFIAMNPADGVFDQVTENVTATVPPFSTAGIYTLCVRGMDADGNLGASKCINVDAEICVQPPSGIIAWWPLDETSGTTAADEVGNSPGLHVNGPVPEVGQVAGSLRFDGVNDYVGVGDSDRWAFGSNDFTVELWAMFNSPGGGSTGHPSHIFIGNDEGPFPVNKWFFALGGGVLEFVFSSPTIGDQFLTFAPFSPNLGQWYHLAIRRQGNTFTAFVNGLPSGSVINTAAIPNPNAPLTIGQAEELGFMNGRLDEVTIYNRALTQGELQGIFNAGSAGKCKALSISTKALSAIQLGTFSTQKLEALFGSAPFNWSIVNGTLPSGMTLTSDGVLSGIPTAAGSFPITIRVTDSQGQIAETAFTLDVLLIPPPSDIRINITGTVPVPGRVGDYFVGVENLGPTSASNVNVHALVVPNQFTLLSADPAPAVDDPNTVLDPNTVRWLIPELAPGEVKVITYKARLKTTVPIGSVVTPAAFINPDVGKTILCLLDAINTAGLCTSCSVACVEALTCYLHPFVCPIAIKDCVDCVENCSQGYDFLVKYCYPKNSPASDSKAQVVRGAVDPNEKVTTTARFIRPDRVLTYPIHFENVGDLEARDVFVTDALDPNLDASTLNLLTPTGGSFDVPTRTVRWDLLNTNLQPGATGNVLLSIRPRPGLPSGTVIRNSATIQFEVFQPIITNEVVNIIDSTRPTSVVNPLPAETSRLDFPISWSGSDAIGEIDFYSILVSVDGGNFTPFLERTRDTNATFSGEAGKTYSFLSIATDTAGNIEVQSATAEASTRVIADCDTGGDNEPPTINGESASPAAMWPPNHTMQDVTISYNAADNCGAVNCVISHITSNEPENGTGDGDTAPDWEIVDANHIRLRAERAGNGAGRIYTITITCRDSTGNSSSKSVTVRVPKSQG